LLYCVVIVDHFGIEGEILEIDSDYEAIRDVCQDMNRCYRSLGVKFVIRNLCVDEFGNFY